MNTAKIALLDKELKKLIKSLIDNDFELGIQAAFYLDGELVVDIAEGRFSPAGRALKSDDLFCVCSTGKGIISTLIHILATRGMIDYDAPVSKYWPEYGVHGKASTTVRQAMAHMAGIPKTPAFKDLAEFCDWKAACAKVAAAVPEWTPGSMSSYHPVSFGWLMGALAERASGREIHELLKTEIFAPLKIEKEMFFGVPEKEAARFSKFIPQPTQQQQVTTDPNTQKKNLAENGWMPPLLDLVNIPEVSAACLPAVNGLMSARALARFYSSLMDEVGGVRLLSDSALDKATALQSAPGSMPECFGHGFGLGYVLKGVKECPGSLFGHGGAGGSEGFANRRLHLSGGITKNRMDTHTKAPGHTNRLIMQVVRRVMGAEGDGGFFVD